jgi:hypothetical protein
MWISGPITTVHDEHICHELTAVARIGLATWRWLSDRSRSTAVVLGNHPISVRRMTGKARTTSIGSQIVDCLLGKAYGHLAGFPAILENESGAG